MLKDPMLKPDAPLPMVGDASNIHTTEKETKRKGARSNKRRPASVGRHATEKISDDGNMPTTRAAASGGTTRPSSKKQKASSTSNTSNATNVGRKLEFRCNWKHALLTYGGFADGEVTKEELRDFVFGKGDAQRWRIGQETYKTPADPRRPIHFHVAIRYKGKPNTKKTTVVTDGDEFDETGAPVYRGKTSCPYDFTTKAGRVVHPNIKTHDSKKRSKKASAEQAEMLSERSMFMYTAKGEQEKDEWNAQHENGPNFGKDANYIEGGDILTFLDEALEAGTATKKPSRAVTFAAMRDAPTVEAAMGILWRDDPEQAMKYGQTIEASLRRRMGGFDEKKYELGDFERPPLDLRKPVLLPGASGVGKTQFAKAHGKFPLVIRSIDQLKKISPNTDLLVFDDMNFGPDGLDWTPEQMIHLLDIDEDAVVKARYVDAVIPKGMRRIFTTNIDPTGMWLDEDEMQLDKNGDPIHPFPRGRNQQHQKAIARRYNLMPYIDAPLYDRKKQRFRKAVVSVVSAIMKKKEDEGSAWAPSSAASSLVSFMS